MLANLFSELSGTAYAKRKWQQEKPKTAGEKLESLQEQRLLLEESKNRKRKGDDCEGIPLLDATRKHKGEPRKKAKLKRPRAEPPTGRPPNGETLANF